MVKLWVALTVCVFLTFPLGAQEDCRCATLSEEQIKELIQKDDSLAIAQRVGRMQKSANASCRFYGNLLRLDYALASIDTLNAARYLGELRTQIKGASCFAKWDLSLRFSELHLLKLRQAYEEMAKKAYEALNRAKSRKDERSEIRAMEDLAYVFNRINEDEKAWKYVLQVKNKFNNSSKLQMKVEDHLWLAFSYETQYTVTEKKKYVDSAEYFALQARDMLKKRSNILEFTQLYRVLEACAYHNGDLPQALVYIDSALWYGQQVKGRVNLGTLYISKAWDHLDLGQNELAVQWMDTCIRYTKKYAVGMAGIDMIYMQAAQIFEAAGEVDRALEAYKQYSHIKDSLFTSERTATINELEQKYEKAQDEKKIAELNERQRTYVFIIVAGVLLIIILIFVFRQRTLRNRQKMLETEQRLNRARIEPHFFFNALTSIQDKAIQEQSPKTVSLLAKFSRIMRQSLENTYTEFVLLAQDIEFLEQYLQLQQARHPDRFDFDIHVAADLDAEALLFPAMLLQPLVENAVEHGFKNLKDGGFLEINYTRVSDQLQVDVIDNGTGATKDSEKHNHVSRATQIMEDRLFILRKMVKKPASYTRVPATTGYHIRVILPLMIDSHSKGNA
jgi:two-component sensor histidine kinase